VKKGRKNAFLKKKNKKKKKKKPGEGGKDPGSTIKRKVQGRRRGEPAYSGPSNQKVFGFRGKHDRKGQGKSQQTKNKEVSVAVGSTIVKGVRSGADRD